MIETFFKRLSSFKPVPFPVMVSIDSSHIAAKMAVAAVVLPIPISPKPMMSGLGSEASITSIPTFKEAIASSSLMAGPKLMFFVPSPTFLFTTPDGVSPLAPTSITSIKAPASRANTLIAAPPAEKLCNIWVVTS